MILDVRPDIYKLDRYLVERRLERPVPPGDPRLARAHGAAARGARGRRGRRGRRSELVAVEAAGIDLVQGFLFARPQPREQLLAAGVPHGPGAGGQRPLTAPRLLLLDDDAAIVAVRQALFRRARAGRSRPAPTRTPRCALAELGRALRRRRSATCTSRRPASARASRSSAERAPRARRPPSLLFTAAGGEARARARPSSAEPTTW